MQNEWHGAPKPLKKSPLIEGGKDPEYSFIYKNKYKIQK
jgi:hypothetical protein